MVTQPTTAELVSAPQTSHEVPLQAAPLLRWANVVAEVSENPPVVTQAQLETRYYLEQPQRTLQAANQVEAITQVSLQLVGERDEARAQSAENYRLATTDPLTGVCNRFGLSEFLKHNDSRVAVLYVDADEFKAVNEKYGHAFGDIIIQKTADAISHSLRKGDGVARLGGDEFVVVIDNDGEYSAEELIEAISGRLEKNIDLVKEEYPELVELGFGASASGVVIEAGESFEEAQKRADEKMQAAKEARKTSQGIVARHLRPAPAVAA